MISHSNMTKENVGLLLKQIPNQKC